ncbi:MAG: hypothetical protein GY950_05330, partial [bacterium]|nr:hypothetical protein [bacterium]
SSAGGGRGSVENGGNGRGRRVKAFALSKGTIVEDLPEIEEVEPLRNLWDNFRRTIVSGQNYNVTGEDGRRALELALRISEHIKKNIADI